MSITRRNVLATGATAALAATLPASTPAQAAAPKLGKQAPGYFRFNVGDFEVTMLHDGVVPVKLETARLPNISAPDFKSVVDGNFLSTERYHNPFTPLVVNTGSKLVLIDTGFADNGAPTVGRLAENMAAAGIDPKAIDIVLISHFHGDHISGVRAKAGGLVYANAEIKIPQRDWDFYYADDARMNATPEAVRGSFLASRRVFGPIAKDVSRLDWGKEVAPGITAIQADGHSPGHTSFVVASGKESLLVVADAANDPRFFARNPEWHFAPDVDKPRAVETRKKLLDMAAADRMNICFYHAAFPSVGFVSKEGSGFRWVPASYTSVL